MGRVTDFLRARAIRTNPAYAKQVAVEDERAYKQEQSNQMALMANEMYGQRATPDSYTMASVPADGPTQPGQQPPMRMDKVPVAGQEATGMYDNDIPLEVRLLGLQQRMAGSGQQGYQDQQADLLGKWQNSMLSNQGAMERQQAKPTSPGAASSMYSNVDIAENGKAYGIRKDTGVYEAIPESPNFGQYGKAPGVGGEGGGDPAKVATAKYYMSLNDADKKAFRESSRAQQYLDLGTHRLNPVTGEQHSKNVIETEVQKGSGKVISGKLEAYPSAKAAGETAITGIDKTIANLAEMSGMADWSTTGFGSWLGVIPMTDAKQWGELKETVMSNVALDSMAELKRLSPTGSTGFGALSQKELDVLQKRLGSLDQAQSPEAIKQSIGKITESLQDLKKSTRKTMDLDSKWYKNNNAPRYGMPSHDDLHAVEKEELAVNPLDGAKQYDGYKAVLDESGNVTYEEI